MSSLDPPQPYRHLVHRLHDPEQFSVAVSGATLAADFLSPQKMPARVEQFQSPGWTLDFHDTELRARILCPIPPGWLSLGFIRRPGTSSWYGVADTGGLLACTGPGEAIDGCIAPGFSSMAVNLPVSLWEQCRALAGVERPSFGGAVALPLPEAVFAQIDRSLRATRHALRCASTAPNLSAFAAREAADLVTHVAVTAWELSSRLAPPRASLRNRTRLAHRAEAWMREHLTDPVQIPEVCLALHVSRRELEYAFRAVFDQSPRDFLQALRLNSIRRTLLCTGVPLTQVAVDHGVTHLGRFAAYYRSLFGERPSETRRRSACIA